MNIETKENVFTLSVFQKLNPPVLAQGQRHMVGFMDTTMLPLSHSPSLQKHRSGVTGQGRGGPLLIGLFS